MDDKVRTRLTEAVVFLGGVLAIAAVYFATAKLGLRMAFVAEQVTVVWPATGLAMGVLLWLGWRYWPGVALGAFLANATAGAPVGTALGIATGNTLESVIAVGLLRWAGFANSFERLKDVLAFVLLAAVGSTMVSATIGVTSLCLGGVQPWEAYGTLWWVWWLGDATGALLVTPLILSWRRWPIGRWEARKVAEAVALLLATAAAAVLLFGGVFDSRFAGHPLPYLVFPFVVWAALRFGQPGTTVATFVVALIAVVGTINGLGPFSAGGVHENLVLLQTFLGVVAITALLLSAAITERDLAERRRATDFAVTQILAQSAGFAEAIPRILDVICENLAWDLGCFWTVDRHGGVLRCVEVRHLPGVHVEKFETITRQSTFAPGIGLPGRVWSSGVPAWLPDVTQDANFPRAPTAVREGLHSGFSFPVRLADEVLGVIEFFSSEIRQPDHDLLRMFATVGGHIGQFLERRRAEDALRDSEKQLRESDRRKDEFLAMLAHELRNPLAPLRNAVQVLRQADNAELVESMRALIERQLQHMIRLVDDLLDLSRVTRGKIELRKERVDLATAIERAIETSRPLLEASHHQLEVSLPECPVWLNADVTRIAQVVTNLLNNAAKYTREGGHIRLRAEREGGDVVIRVQDDGIGIPASMLPHVFDMFTQVDTSPERSQGGLGIGLTLVKTIVALHGGSVQATSAGLGQGSEFLIRLPIGTEAASAAGESHALTDQDWVAPSRRILVVDDNRDAADSLAMLLRLRGHEVQTAYDGAAALEIARAYRPEVMLLDLGMPRMSGYEVARQARKSDALRDTVLVAVTGWGQAEDRQRSEEAGFDDHITKPADPAVLEKLLASLPRHVGT
jgi:signal transduction histidine kinase/integral membrane sensor domain MASE1/ActR/RegA family two-component response regulator